METGNQSPPRVLILGDRATLATALIQKLTALGAYAATIHGRDSELTETLGEADWTAVVVLAHDDPLALRLTLLSAHVRPDLPLWVTLFDRTIVHRFHEIVPSVNVVPFAELVATTLAQHCQDLIDIKRQNHNGARIVDDALRLMTHTGIGLILMLVVQTIITMISLHNNFVDALYFSTRSIATVADPPRAADAPAWFKLISTMTTVAAVVFLAIFTAALVRRLSRPRLTTLLGRRQPAARNHALLVGFGQIGFRLAQELQRRGFRVIALERDVNAPLVRLARRAGIPVAVGRGDDREALEALGVRSCAVLAAVTSEDLTNVAIGLAASDVRPDVPLVMRLGDGNVADETESLLHLGRVCDAHELIAGTLAAAICAA